MSGSLAGQCVVVTGGGSGIGEATCRVISREGGQVAVLGRTMESIQRVADECGGVAVQVDVGDADQVQRAVNEAAEHMGALTGLCNNAGTGSMNHLHKTAPRTWQRIVEVNLTGTFYGIRAAAPLMLAGEGGAIVNTASISGIRPSPGESAYAASKAGVVAITAAAALEYAPAIRVNSVSPGVVRTNLTVPLMKTGEEALRSAIPMGRVGEPADVAELIVFLLSSRAAWITGQNITVDGGTTLRGAGIEHVAKAWRLERR